MRAGRRMLLVAFLLAAALTAVLGARLVASTVYWSSHRDAPIEAWMTVGMVARSYHVPRGIVAVAAGLPDGARDRRPLSEIAAERGVAADELIAAIDAAIAAHRAAPASRPTESSP